MASSTQQNENDEEEKIFLRKIEVAKRSWDVPNIVSSMRDGRAYANVQTAGCIALRNRVFGNFDIHVMCN